jgi:hypothetical protein
VFLIADGTALTTTAAYVERMCKGYALDISLSGWFRTSQSNVSRPAGR